MLRSHYSMLFARRRLTPTIVPSFYGLPEKFVPIWRANSGYKNHIVVVRPSAELAKREIPPVAITGLPADYRDPTNATVSTLLQTIAREGLAGQIIPLGLIPRATFDRSDAIGKRRDSAISF